jgi:hypothetical protein
MQVLFPSCATTLQLGLGALLLWDAYERRESPTPPPPATFAASVLAGILLVGLCLRPSSMSATISAVIGLVSSIAAGHNDPWSGFAGDTLLRWMLLWHIAGAGTSFAGHACLQSQLAWLYLGSLLHKDVGAYVNEAHAARSLLLTEHYDARDSPWWRMAVQFASDPSLAQVQKPRGQPHEA